MIHSKSNAVPLSRSQNTCSLTCYYKMLNVKNKVLDCQEFAIQLTKIYLKNNDLTHIQHSMLNDKIYSKLFLNDIMTNFYIIYIKFSLLHYVHSSIMPSYTEILLILCNHISQLFIAFLGAKKLSR